MGLSLDRRGRWGTTVAAAWVRMTGAVAGQCASVACVSDAYGAADGHRDLAEVARGVSRWADTAADSPLYAFLARRVAGDPELLALVAQIPRTPPMNLLLGGIKLRLREADALAAWYPHLAGAHARTPDDAAFAAFREHVLAHADALLELGRTRRTQTNEASRAAVVLPWIAAAAEAWGEPVHLVDVGASAGLNLCLDRFEYRYFAEAGTVVLAAADPAASRVTLACELRDGLRPPRAVPTIATRTGLELEPVDPTDPDSAAWLEALVWPEHEDRLERLRAALAIRRETPVAMVAGDAAQNLPGVLEALPPGPVAVIHTVMAYQLSDPQRAALDAACVQAGRERPLVRIGMEPWSGSPHPRVTLGASQHAGRVVASAHAHGRWLARPERRA